MKKGFLNGHLLGIVFGQFLLLGCSSEQSGKLIDKYTCIDTLVFNLLAETYMDDVVIYDNEGESYYMFPDYQRGSLTGLNIGNQVDSFFISVPFHEISASGIEDYFLINSDSVLLVPKLTRNPENELVLVVNGKVRSRKSFQNEAHPFNYAGSYLNRLAYLNGKVYSNLFYRDFRINDNGTSSNNSVYNLPHHSIYDFKSDTLRYFGSYPNQFKSGTYAFPLVMRQIVNKAVVFAYTYSFELHIHSLENSDEVAIIDLKDLMGSRNIEAVYNSQRELAMRSDLLLYMVYNPHQRRLYVVQSPGIEYLKNHGNEVATWEDKAQVVYVFNDQFQHIGTVRFPSSNTFNLINSFPTKAGLLCPTNNWTMSKHEYVLITIE